MYLGSPSCHVSPSLLKLVQPIHYWASHFKGANKDVLDDCVKEQIVEEHKEQPTNVKMLGFLSFCVYIQQ